jgi:hypothetical protein
MALDFRNTFKLDELTRFELRLLAVCVAGFAFAVGFLLDLFVLDQFAGKAAGIMISNALTGVILALLAYKLMSGMVGRQQAFLSQLAIVAEMSRQLRTALTLLERPLNEPAVRERTGRELENVYGNLKELTSQLGPDVSMN